MHCGWYGYYCHFRKIEKLPAIKIIDNLRHILSSLNSILWNEYWIMIIAFTGLVFTIWSGFAQYKIIRHTPKILGGEFNNKNDDGVISHFQALSTALSGTVGLGNISGVALAITLGGPGAIFWMWVIAIFGMAIKLIEVILSMLYRNTEDPENPHGGPMWVAENGFKKTFPKYKKLGKTLAILFAISIATSSITGGNMFQAWSVADITYEYFGIEGWVTGIILSIIVAAVILGGIERIAKVTSKIVPVMVTLYILAGFYVLSIHISEVPEMLILIVTSAFTTTQASGAFIGGTVGTAFMFGTKRAIFSNEAGQGSSPIVHAAVKTNEPVREGMIAGIEPLIDTIVVCTFTALIILSTGTWDRKADIEFDEIPTVNYENNAWSFSKIIHNEKNGKAGDPVIMLVEAGKNKSSNQNIHKIPGKIMVNRDNFEIQWNDFSSDIKPKIITDGYFYDYVGATMTAKAFDSVNPGLGKWLITIASWFFAISTIMAWGYYGEQGIIYLAGEQSKTSFRIIYCLLIFIATLGFIETSVDLDNLSGIGLGIIVYANLPICWVFGYQAIRAYKAYINNEKVRNIEN